MKSLTIAMYLRLSKDDEVKRNGTAKQSNSITNQRILIQNFIVHHLEFLNAQVVEYCDDGYSGTNFERPGVIGLLKDVKAKKVNCIIVKDFSRFGRDYLEVGNYMDQIFPFIGVRFIAINDCFDSMQNIGGTVGIEIAVKNLMNDYYCKDISQKVKSSLTIKKKEGKYLGGYVLYGYQRSPIEKGKLMIDEEAATIVRKIFEMTRAGYRRSDIARYLNERQVPTPIQHIMTHSGRRTIGYTEGKKYYWTLDAIIRILQNQVYLGNTISGKYKVKEVGSKQTILLPKQEWYIIEDTHEPIISEELYEAAKQTFHPRKMVRGNDTDRKNNGIINNNKSNNIFKKVKCGSCYYAMDLIKGNNSYYKCISHRFVVNAQCSSDHLDKKELEKNIVLILQMFRNLFLKNIDLCRNCIEKDNTGVVDMDEKVKYMKNNLKRRKLQDIRDYEKYRNGLLYGEEYILKKEREMAKKNEYRKVMEQIEERQKDSEHKSIPNHEYTKSLIPILIDNIYFYDANRIEIVFTFKGEYEGDYQGE